MSDAQAPAPVSENGVPPVAYEKVEEAPGFKVFAGNLSYITTDEGLKAFFAPIANDIISAQVVKHGPRSAGYGFVSFSSAESAEKVVEELNRTELDGREVVVEIAKPSDQKDNEKRERKPRKRFGRRGYHQAVPGEVTEAEANGEASKADGAGESESQPIKPKKKKSSRKPRKSAAPPAAAVGDASGEVAPVVESEVAADATETVGTRKPRVRKPRTPRPSRPVGEVPAGQPSKTVLFVANLGFNVDDTSLAAVFTDAGVNVASARIVRRRFGHPRKSKGFGFVDVGNEEEQKKAIASLDGKEVDGRAIVVKIAVDSVHDDVNANVDGADVPAASAA